MVQTVGNAGFSDLRWQLWIQMQKETANDLNILAKKNSSVQLINIKKKTEKSWKFKDRSILYYVSVSKKNIAFKAIKGLFTIWSFRYTAF